MRRAMSSIGPRNQSNMMSSGSKSRPGQTAAVPTETTVTNAIVTVVETVATLLTGQTLAMPQPVLLNHNFLNALEMSQLLRTLMKLPNDMLQLLSLLDGLDTTLTQTLVKELLTENPDLPLDDLQALLAERLSKAQDKLLKLIQADTLSGGKEGAQLRDLLASLGELSERGNGNPEQTLHTAISLFLPYAPINAPLRFRLQFEDAESADTQERKASGDNSAAPQLHIWMSTDHLGNFRIALSLEQATRVLAQIHHEAIAEPYCGVIRERIENALPFKQLPLPQLIFSAMIRPHENPSLLTTVDNQTSQLSDVVETSTSGKTVTPDRTVRLQSGKTVSTLTVLWASWLIRIILELDARLGQMQNNV